MCVRWAYAASQTTVLHMKRLNQTESPIFITLCFLFCFVFYCPESVGSAPISHPAPFLFHVFSGSVSCLSQPYPTLSPVCPTLILPFQRFSVPCLSVPCLYHPVQTISHPVPDLSPTVLDLSLFAQNIFYSLV